VVTPPAYTAPSNQGTPDSILFDPSATDATFAPLASAPGVSAISSADSNPPSVSDLGSLQSVKAQDVFDRATKGAMADRGRVQDLKSAFEQVATEYDLPPALLAGISSRESGVGSQLGSNDNAPGWGDHNNGYGIMQIDKRSDTPDTSTGPDGIANIEQGAQVLSEKVDAVQKAHPDWTRAQVLRGATAAYNEGAGNVQTLSGMDRGTTYWNYSSDVWTRAQYFDQTVFSAQQPQPRR
jgi:soluble lytic murein transglycosylase-like protein